MKSKKLISAILAAASIAGGVVGVQAQTVEGLESKVDSYTSRVQQAETRIGTLETKVKALDTTGIADNKAKIEAEATARTDADKKLQDQITTNKDAIATQGTQISQLQKDTDKQHWQIDALEKKTGVNTPLTNGAFSLSDGVNANTGKINENTSKIDANTGKINALDKTVDKQHWQIDALEKKTGVNTPLTNGATNLSAGVNQNTKLLEAEAKARDEADTKLQGNIKAEETARKAEDQKLQKQIKTNGIKADTALKVIGNGAMQNGATNLTDGVNQNTRLVEAEAKARDDADHKLQTNIDNEVKIRENAVNALNSRIGQVESDANKGIAKASALAALHPLDYDPDNKFDIAAAGGFYKGENAFALGAFYRPNRNVMLSMGTTLTSGDNAYNVGLTFKIGKSGKHTEAGLTTADLYAMIGAMQDKMDQQQKKIEELEAKQAK